MGSPQKPTKVYVAVDLHVTTEGRMLHRAIHWEDGQIYEIDKVMFVRPAPASRAGGQGDRYTLKMNGREKYLFYEHSTEYGNDIPGRWFVERKEE